MEGDLGKTVVFKYFWSFFIELTGAEFISNERTILRNYKTALYTSPSG